MVVRMPMVMTTLRGWCNMCPPCFLAGLQRAKRASEAPCIRKIGNPSSRENLVMTSPYERPFSLQTLGEGEGRLNIDEILHGGAKI